MNPDIQNEILSIMAQFIQRELAKEVSGRWFTIMVDETTDLSNTEQMVRGVLPPLCRREA